MMVLQANEPDPSKHTFVYTHTHAHTQDMKIMTEDGTNPKPASKGSRHNLEQKLSQAEAGRLHRALDRHSTLLEEVSMPQCAIARMYVCAIARF